MNWKEIKAEVLQNCAKAGISDKGFIKTILLLERRVMSAKNLSQKASWDAVCNSTPYHQASSAIALLNGGGGESYDENGRWRGYGDEPRYGRLYRQYCSVTSICFDAYIGDWLA